VGRVEAFQIDGCRCWFFSHDHLDPHFHAKSPGEWEVRVFFLEEPPRLEVKFALSRVPAPLRKLIAELARTHRVALLEEWSRKVKVD
jgi:hypothetical protein